MDFEEGGEHAKVECDCKWKSKVRKEEIKEKRRDRIGKKE